MVISDLAWSLHPDMDSLVYVEWTQNLSTEAHVEFSVDQGIWMSSPSVAREAGVNEQLLVGIPFDTEARWRVVSGDRIVYGDDVRTGDYPEGLPVPTVQASEPSAWALNDQWFLSSINQDNGGWTGGVYWTFIMDRKGRMVWARPAPSRHWTLFAQISVTGDHILWDEATFWSDFDGGEGSTVHRTYLDEEIEEISTPGLHHAFVELPDGTLAWGSQDHGGGEALVELAPGAPDETVVWTCSDDWPGVGGCESNCLYYDETRDSYLYSFYTNSSVVEVDRATGESLWWAGTVADGYDFDPPEARFTWQHGISWTDDRTILLSTHRTDAGPSTTFVREYELDEDAGMLNQVWSHDSAVFAETNGQAWRLDNGNTLHVIGSGTSIKEITVANEEVWVVDFEGDKLLGHGQFMPNLYNFVAP
jgi:hypothetical protein